MTRAAETIPPGAWLGVCSKACGDGVSGSGCAPPAMTFCGRLDTDTSSVCGRLTLGSFSSSIRLAASI
eukprot:scaffold147633_cov35-Tisochrysis_lutea.AAC.3